MLYLCATPIGNLQDITLRVLDALRKADLIACEDTRRTRVLLDRHGVKAQLMSFHDHNEEQRLAVLLPLLREGKEVAVVTDAGMPGLSDPGFSLVRACAEEGLDVTVLPGPSAVPTALVLSGLPADRFAFVGFLARGQGKLVEQVAAFDGTGASVVAFEAPSRVRGSLATIGERWPNRRLAVCRELTKLHEETVRGTASEVLGRLPDRVRGEIVLVLEPVGGQDARRGPHGPDDVIEALGMLIESGLGVKKAATVVATLAGLSRRTVYEAALGIKRGERDTPSAGREQPS